jgi:uncharacterized protein YjbI with pentapeptide repeats
MDATELLKRYTAGARYFSRVDLSIADLSGVNLSGANLSGANLSGADLRRANLRKADLSGADLSSADLSGADLSGADLRRANLRKADLRRADLREADLRRAKLREAIMVITYLIGADLSGADLIEANLRRAILNGAYLIEANLRRADLSGANLIGADLSGANLIGANLFGAVLTNTKLESVKVDGTILAEQKKSEELQRENQDLRDRIDFFETQIEKLIEQQVQKRLITNQGISAKKSLTWNRLRFRSEAEVKIAKVLDEMGVMFFPNAWGRVMSEEGMINREVDFLICWRGKWGILECDNEIMHLVNSLKKGKLPSAARDHNRDKDFNRHGQWFIKRFTEEECKKNPHKVVSQFLDMLHKFHEDQRYLITGDSPETESYI